MAKVKIYTIDFCPFCVRAKALLQQKNIGFEEELVDSNDVQRMEELKTKANMRTMPQIYIHDKCIGGFQELAALDQSGQLQKLLEQN